jgi:hypothetical protein
MAKKSSLPVTESSTKKKSAPRAAAASKRHTKATPALPAVETAQEAVLDHNEVARLAYSYWVARNYQHGSSVEDWLRAERELLGR